MHELADNLILEVQHLHKHFPVHRGLLRRRAGTVKAVDDVSFRIRRGTTLGLVGESGCGKTTTSRMILRAIDPTSGRILFRRPGGDVVDIAALPTGMLKPLRGEIQMIFQDPYSSLNPRLPVMELIAEPLRSHGWKKRDREQRVRELMERVGLDPRYARRFPHAFSGGQRQRIGIARALALQPALIVADEPVSALDVSVQAQILNLLKQLRHELGLTFLFVAHDLSVIRYLCDEVAVMYQGRIVEWADTETLFHNPLHPYTQTLLQAAPAPDPHVRWLEQTGSASDATDSPAEPDAAAEDAPAGCAFAPRCAYAIEACRQAPPPLENQASDAAPAHHVACIRAAELDLPGVGGDNKTTSPAAT